MIDFEEVALGYRGKAIGDLDDLRSRLGTRIDITGWVYGSCAINIELGQAFIICHYWGNTNYIFDALKTIEVEKKTLCRLSPYTDSFKKHIYEKDVLKVLNNGLTLMGEVVKKENLWGVREFTGNTFIPFSKLQYESLEILGNVLDNKTVINLYKASFKEGKRRKEQKK